MVRMVTQLHTAQPTYSEIGFTLAKIEPSGYHNDRYEAELGQGTDTFARSVQGLRAWGAHRLPGIQVFPKNAEIVVGATVIVTLGTPLLAVAAPCRIVEVLDESHRWGFAYGTLPGHPEQGEGSFIVSVSDDQVVRFEIRAFDRPGEAIVQNLGPLSRGIQKVGTHGYIRALKRLVKEGI
jgi:uncharacterized protein (UPF0548 family)